jgi:hypothetical protein
LSDIAVILSDIADILSDTAVIFNSPIAVLTPNGNVWIVPLLHSVSDMLLRNLLQF